MRADDDDSEGTRNIEHRLRDDDNDDNDGSKAVNQKPTVTPSSIRHELDGLSKPVKAPECGQVVTTDEHLTFFPAFHHGPDMATRDGVIALAAT